MVQRLLSSFLPIHVLALEFSATGPWSGIWACTCWRRGGSAGLTVTLEVGRILYVEVLVVVVEMW